MNSYYNTNRLKGLDLFSSNQKAKTQEDLILSIFKDGKGEYTPFDIQQFLMLQGKVYPITSVRRAITNLTKMGLLVKTTSKKEGDYGQDRTS